MNIYCDGSYHPPTGLAGAAAVIDDGKAVRVVRRRVKCTCSNDAEFAALLIAAREADNKATIYTDHIGWVVKSKRPKADEFGELLRKKSLTVTWFSRMSLPLLRQAHLQAGIARKSATDELFRVPGFVNPVDIEVWEAHEKAKTRAGELTYLYMKRTERIRAKVARMLEDQKQSYEARWIQNK